MVAGLGITATIIGLALQDTFKDIISGISIIFENRTEEKLPTDLSEVFERFYKGDLARTGVKNGSGLGLYIVKTVINKHGGDVYAKSGDGKTEFCFSLPIGKP